MTTINTFGPNNILIHLEPTARSSIQATAYRVDPPPPQSTFRQETLSVLSRIPPQNIRITWCASLNIQPPPIGSHATTTIPITHLDTNKQNEILSLFNLGVFKAQPDGVYRHPNGQIREVTSVIITPSLRARV